MQYTGTSKVGGEEIRIVALVHVVLSPTCPLPSKCEYSYTLDF